MICRSFVPYVSTHAGQCCGAAEVLTVDFLVTLLPLKPREWAKSPYRFPSKKDCFYLNL